MPLKYNVRSRIILIILIILNKMKYADQRIARLLRPRIVIRASSVSSPQHILHLVK